VTSADPTFRHLADDVVFSGRVVTLSRSRFAAPDGNEFEREIVRHPGAVAVVAVHDGDVVLVRQYRAPLDRWLLELPAGLRDKDGEDPAETARRELIEEAGLAAGRMEHLCAMAAAPGMADEIVDIYLARDLSPVDTEADGVEEQWMTIERIPLDEARRRLDAGEFIDAKTVVGLHQYFARS